MCYIYIYIYRERERYRYIHINKYMYIYTHIEFWPPCSSSEPPPSCARPRAAR